MKYYKQLRLLVIRTRLLTWVRDDIALFYIIKMMLDTFMQDKSIGEALNNELFSNFVGTPTS